MRPSGLVLSIFPGLGLLDRAFEFEGFCVVRGPDPIWGGDVRDFHPPRRAFEGIIGGDPCQSHSPLSNLVRAKGLEPSFPDLTEEYARVVAQVEPLWFLRENVRNAPALHVDGYGIHTFVLDNASLLAEDGFGMEQTRKRRFWFGVRDRNPVDLRRWIDFAALELPAVPAVGSGHDSSPSGFPRSRARRATVTGRHTSDGMGSAKPGNPGRYTIEQMVELQGLPPDFLRHAPFTSRALRKAIGNGVPQAMGRALASAITHATEALEQGRRRRA